MLALFPASGENGHAVKLARNLRSALTAATALLAFLVDRHFFPIPNPAPLFVCIVALAASVSGIVSGMASAVIAVAASALFFLNHRAAPGYDPSDLARMLLLAATAGGTALITGLLRQKWVDSFAWDKKHHATANRLSAALDQVDIGIVLLDSDTRAEFINRAFRIILRCPTSRPTASRPSSR
jgi:Osmosensitive K+ channel histidine kinase